MQQMSQLVPWKNKGSPNLYISEDQEGVEEALRQENSCVAL
jgi:hypothetical protein